MERERASRKPRPTFAPEPLQMTLLPPGAVPLEDTRSWTRPTDGAHSKVAGRPMTTVNIDSAGGTVIDLAGDDEDAVPGSSVFVIDLA